MSTLRKQKQIRLSRRHNHQQTRLTLTVAWQENYVAGVVTGLLKRAAAKAWLGQGRASVNISFVSVQESQSLNYEWRSKDKPTNILSFPFELPDGWVSREHLLGDLIICPTVLFAEACDQNKSLAEHAAHLVVHGLLHLQGYDHETEFDAAVMETLETRILAQVGIKNPYLLAE